MIFEEKWMWFRGQDDILDILAFARDIGIEGRGVVELGEEPYIEFDDPVNGSYLMDVGQYMLTATIDDEQRTFVLDKREFDNRLKSGAVIEFERLLNVLLPTLSDSADVYDVLSQIMGVNIFTDDGKIINVDGTNCVVSLNFDPDVPMIYAVSQV